MRSMLLSSVHQWAFLMVLYSATFLASTKGSFPTRISLVMLFATTFLFAMYMVQVVTDYSPFRLADIEDHVRIDKDGTLDWPVIALLTALSAVLYVLSIGSFRQRTP